MRQNQQNSTCEMVKLLNALRKEKKIPNTNIVNPLPSPIQLFSYFDVHFPLYTCNGLIIDQYFRLKIPRLLTYLNIFKMMY